MLVRKKGGNDRLGISRGFHAASAHNFFRLLYPNEQLRQFKAGIETVTYLLAGDGFC